MFKMSHPVRRYPPLHLSGIYRVASRMRFLRYLALICFFHRSMRGQDCKRTHSAQGNAGYIYEAKRREIKEIETMRGARVCLGFDFSVETFFE